MIPLIGSVGQSGERMELHRIDSIPSEYVKPTLDYNATHSIMEFDADGSLKGAIEIELIGSESLIPSGSKNIQSDVIMSLWCKVQDRLRSIQLDTVKEKPHKHPHIFTVKEIIDAYEASVEADRRMKYHDC